MAKYTMEDLISIVKRLRAPDGCPWDKVQTHESIKKNMIEECYEAIDALDNGTDHDFANELGDVLLQVVFHAVMAEERGAFDFSDVVDEICTKLISRHTHIFGNDSADSVAEALDNWEKNKKKEKGFTTYTEVLKDVPAYLPALMRAEKLQKKAADIVGGEGDSEKAFARAKRALENYRTAEDKESALGTLLFEIAGMGRLYKVSSELALTGASNSFIECFSRMEEELGEELSGLGIDEVKAKWSKFD